MLGFVEGGDDACWLDRVCDRCGAFVEDAATHVCRRPVDDDGESASEPDPAV